MVCAHCGAQMAASQRVCHRCGQSANGETTTSTVFGVTELTSAAETPTPLPGKSPDYDESLTIAPVSQGEPDTHARPAVIAGGQPTEGLPAAAAPLQGSATGTFQTGTPFGRRYHLIRPLGVGGMGAVYQAWDDELAVVVAIKVIRPEAMADPAVARDLERRFKRELLLARNVTHKNVVRIHDLGEIDGVKYITMPYVNGSDLATVLKREGRLTVPRALALARQIASGLVAAHEAGVVHRDLKPANILLDEEDHALITDFGIARSVSGPGGGTVVGTVVGTLDYMAPEQARAEATDHRADIYAFGWMLSDMLVGRRKVGNGESAIAELLDRLSKPAPPMRSVDPAIPQAIDDIVARCVQPDPALRYQRTQELLIDLEAAAGDPATNSRTGGATRPQMTPVPAMQPQATTITISLPNLLSKKRSRNWIAAGVLALLAAGGGLFVYRTVTAPKGATSDARVSTPAAASVSLAILPFRNASGDNSLDYLGPTVAETLGTAIGQSAALKTIPAGRVAQILGDLRITPDSNLDPAALGRLAELSGADTVIWGQYVKFGNEIRIDATLQDVKHQRTIPLKTQAANESDLPTSIDRLGASVRDSLALSKAAVKELAATSFKPSTSNVAALRYYTEGRELSRQSRYLDALKKFEASTQEDPRFALAYSKLADTYWTLGYDAEAEKNSRMAVEHSDALPAAEKQLIVANRARMLNDYAKAIELYESLDKRLPQNDDVLIALAAVHEDTGAYDKAFERFKQLLGRDPKYIEALLGAGRVELRNGRPNEATAQLTPALTLAIQRGNDQARAEASWLLGIAYMLLNRPDEALRQHQQSLEIARRTGYKRLVLQNLKSIAQLQDDRGEFDRALKSYSEALALGREIGGKRAVGDVLVELGSLYFARGVSDRALEHYREALQIQREVRNQTNEAAVLNNIGAIYLHAGNYEDARTHLERALAIYERSDAPAGAASTLSNLGDIATRTGDYQAAVNTYLKALDLRREIDDKRGAAMDRYNMGLLFEYQGRFGAALDSRTEAVKTLSELGEGGIWMVRALLAQGSALSQIGRFDEGQKVLSEALKRAKELKSDDLLARTLIVHGDTLYYRGDLAAAREQYQQGEQIAKRSKLHDLELKSRLGLAMMDVKSGRQNTPVALKGLGADLKRLGLAYESVQCVLLSGEADLNRENYKSARSQAELALEQSDRLGSLTLAAQAEHLLARTARAASDAAEARRHSTRAQQLLQQIQEQAPKSDVLKRFDLKAIADEASTR
jgi:eukaryotic-like serine/threonine-protein kinase